MNNRRDFLKKVALAGTSAVIGSQIEALGSNGVSSSFSGTSEGGGLIVPKSNGLKITGSPDPILSHPNSDVEYREIFRRETSL